MGRRSWSKIFRIIQEINSQGTSILLVEQNALMALQVAHRAYVLETGRIVLQGSAKELRESPRVKEAYLGLPKEALSTGTETSVASA
jgi:branched-chain amino acid transport system ATP-binding protein